MQEMRLSDVLFLFSASPTSASRFSKHLGILDSRSFVPITRMSQGIRVILRYLAVSFPCSCSSYPPSPHPIYSPFIPISHLPHYIPSQTPYTPQYTHFTHFMTNPFCPCLGFLLSVALALVFFRSNDVVCSPHPRCFLCSCRLSGSPPRPLCAALRDLITTLLPLVRLC